MLQQESFAWDQAERKQKNLNTVALPTQTESEFKKDNKKQRNLVVF